jgi:hypothetical protein
MPPGFMAAISILARRQHRKVSDLFRQTFVSLLDSEGIAIDPDAPPRRRRAAKHNAVEASE